MHIVTITALVGSLASGANAAYAIFENTGGVSPNGARPDRLEITGFAGKAGPGWDLYVQCMADFQKLPQDKQLSYYQICGIHGRPFAAWDNVRAADGDHAGGYCPHSSVLFPTWHRPYLQLFEQQIWECAQRRAKEYPNASRASYVNAAVSLRLPYWDWVKTASLPDIVTVPKVTVNTASGRRTMDNPLYQYTFTARGGPGTADFPGSSGFLARAPGVYKTSVRAPTNGVTSNANANRALARQAGYLRDTVYRILTTTTNYGEMSNNGYTGPMEGAGSFENPHGTIHNAVGGNGGHMTYLDYAAFDPIFWLHHANVDRLFTIWQTLYPEQWDINQEDDTGTYSIQPGTVQTDETPLYPFAMNSDGDFFASTDVRNTQALGYSYPEVRDWDRSPEQATAFAKIAIRALYSPGAGSRPPRRQRHKKRANGPSPALCGPDGTTTPMDPSPAMVDGQYKDWFINVEVDKFATNSSFNVYFFMKEPSKDASEWPYDKSLIGVYSILRPVTVVGGPRTKMIRGTMPLTRTLLKAVTGGHIDNLEIDEATPYLLSHLRYRVANTEGVEIPLADIPSLKCSAMSQCVVPPKAHDEFPEYAPVRDHGEVASDPALGFVNAGATGATGATAAATVAVASASSSSRATYSFPTDSPSFSSTEHATGIIAIILPTASPAAAAESDVPDVEVAASADDGQAGTAAGDVGSPAEQAYAAGTPDAGPEGSGDGDVPGPGADEAAYL